MNKLTLSPLIKLNEKKGLNLPPFDIPLPHKQPMVCPYNKCGKAFSRPIELTIRTQNALKTYYACPHCFSRVAVLNKRENAQEKAVTDTSNCAYFVGYLKTRPKDSPIPDECLTCNKILKCI
jgi:DNA-directed RNA polymerase subunit RPC12/RpoP